MTTAGAPPPRVFVALGANLGDRAAQLRAAVAALDAAGVPVLAASPVYASPAHTLDGAPQPPYLNAVVEVAPALGPEALLAVLHEVERRAGRTRRARWAPRTLDLDLLLYGAEVRDAGGFVLPHPRMAERRFVLRPLADLAPDLPVPPAGATVAALLARCPDPGPLTRTAHALR